ncbi:hypothetical protein GJAV_G00032670 [Gymnothorax javanicus]|nr:hypothetical protein GJAV_G00032670 [Gymnothorax javanicus]
MISSLTKLITFSAVPTNREFSAVTLAFPPDAYYLPKQENEFIHKVFEDLEILLQENSQNSVLVFPPLPSRLCELIQKTMENNPSMCSFPVGEDWSRRMVVCRSHLRISSGSDGVEGCGTYDHSLGLETGMQNWKARFSPMPGTRQMNGRDKERPDKASFNPLAFWEREHASSSLSVSEESSSDSTEEFITANRDELSDCSDRVTHEQDDFVNLSSCGLKPWFPSWELPVSYFSAMSLDHSCKDACGEDTVLSAPAPQIDGSCIGEIISKLKEQDVIILSAQNDYSCYENDAWVDAEAFGHILEIYNIPSLFTSEDLLDAFADFSVKGLKIHWVDNRLALAVFSSKAAALQALSLKHPLIRVRKLSSGTKKSRGKALRLSEFLKPMTEVTDFRDPRAMDIHIQDR